MFHENGTTVVHKRMSFLSIAIVSLSAIIVVTVLSASGIAIYGLRLVDKKTDGLIGLLTESAKVLPELREALPPALTDAIDDERRPGYREHLRVLVRLTDDEQYRRRARAIVSVENTGDEIVSLLSMRLVALDEDGEPIGERATWAATPLQVENEWRGPILPGEIRRFTVWCCSADDAATISHEITDIRVWMGKSGPEEDALDA